MVRYSNNYQLILLWDINDFIDQVEIAFKKKQDELLLSRWIANYETQMSYDEFISNLGIKVNSASKNKKTIEEITIMVDEIINNL